MLVEHSFYGATIGAKWNVCVMVYKLFYLLYWYFDVFVHYII
ncbi:hypothetical protein LY58_03103 [Salegentibacter salegens]|nr:hypothetical protein LY58_03103 [Salegentibacter salegens]